MKNKALLRCWRHNMLLELPALQGHTPIGFMAGIGLLQIAPKGTKLSWNRQTQSAEIHGVERGALLTHLVQHMKGRAAAPELQLADDVRGFSVEKFRAHYEMAEEPLASWMRAWWREDGKGGNTTPTNLCLTGGPQRMIKMARELATHLEPSKKKGAEKFVADKFEEALFGPWRYEDNFASWGWDPATFRLGAVTSSKPSEMNKEGVAGAYWLAWESQPLFPCLHGESTLGFNARQRVWTWATWGEPLDLHAATALMRQPKEAKAIGGARYRSGIVFAGQFQFFEPAQLFT
jgi:hypothetical protein